MGPSGAATVASRWASLNCAGTVITARWIGPICRAAWRARHQDLHPYETLRAEVAARYDERDFEWRPYLYRWLQGPATEALEEGLISAGAIRPIGFRYAGVRRETVRSSAESR